MSWRPLLVGLVLAGCGPDDLAPAPVDRDCAPQYAPTFDNVHANTLVPNCAVSGCHNETSAQGGMSLEDIEDAFAEVGDRVTAGDPENRELIMRVFSTSDDWRMPPGDEAPLSAAEQCALALWVLNGAER